VPADVDQRAVATELLRSITSKHASASVRALAPLMHVPSVASDAIPVLLEWLAVQSGMYLDVITTLIASGELLTPFLVDRLSAAASAGDDELVRNLLDLAARARADSMIRAVEASLPILAHENAHVRESAVDGIAQIGLPDARLAVPKLLAMEQFDSAEHVRVACREALDHLSVSR